MKLIKAWNSINFILRIFLGLVLGVVLGLLIPGNHWIAIPGTLFVWALKAIAPILVFVLVASSLASAKGGNAKEFRTVIFLYLLSTLLAAIVSVVICFIFPVEIPLTGLEEQDSVALSIGEIIEGLLLKVVTNPIESMFTGNYIGILFWAVVLGIALKKASDVTKTMLQDLANAVSGVVKGVISFAPFGIMGLSYEAISESGIDIFKKYGRLVLVLVGAMLVVGLVLNPLIVGIALKRNPYPLVFYCIKNSGLTAFFTRSSAANIPVNMQLCKKLGLDEDIYSVSIPLGSTINMDGAAVTITIYSLVAAASSGVQVSFPIALLLSILATFSACGASGVAGGSLLLVPVGCSLLGLPEEIAMQMVAVGFILSVVQDSMETALNSSGDALFTATAEFRKWQKQGKKLPLWSLQASREEREH